MDEQHQMDRRIVRPKVPGHRASHLRHFHVRHHPREHAEKRGGCDRGFAIEGNGTSSLADHLTCEDVSHKGIRSREYLLLYMAWWHRHRFSFSLRLPGHAHGLIDEVPMHTMLTTQPIGLSEPFRLQGAERARHPEIMERCRPSLPLTATLP